MAAVQSMPVPPWMPQDLGAARWLFHEVTANLKCGDILHVHDDTCLSAFTGMLRDCIIGSSKFFIPFYAMHFIWNGKKTLNRDKAFYKKMGYFYVRSIIFGATMGCLFGISSCTLVRLTGFSYWTTVFGSGAIAGLSIFLEHQFRRRIVMNTFFNLTLNYLYRRAQVSDFLPPRSAVAETAFFMAVSGLLLHLLHRARADNKETPVFWFYIPDAVKEQPAQVGTSRRKKCPVPHRGACWVSTLQETTKFSALAAALQALRLLIMSPGGRSPAIFFKGFFSRRTLASITSIGGYVFLYKTVRCALGTRCKTDKSEHSALAGLAAGSAYWFLPNTTILFSALIAAIQMLADLLPGRLKAASQWPMPCLLFAICNGILFHARCQDMANCPKFIITMMDLATRNRARTIYNSYMQHLLEFEAKILGN